MQVRALLEGCKLLAVALTSEWLHSGGGVLLVVHIWGIPQIMVLKVAWAGGGGGHPAEEGAFVCITRLLSATTFAAAVAVWQGRHGRGRYGNAC